MKIKLFIAGFFIAMSSAVFADDQTIIHVTPDMLSKQAGIPLDWKVSYKQYDFDIENETQSAISVAIKVTTESYPENVKLALSSIGDCGTTYLSPQQYIVCKVQPHGHLELGYNIFPEPKEEPKDFIMGKFTLGKLD